VTAAQAFFRLLGRDTAVVRNVPGGVFPGIFAMIVNEAAFALGEGVASAEDIDTALRLGANYPAGPLTAADRIGLDVLLATLEGLQREIDADRYRPAPLLRSLISKGRRDGGADGGFTKGV
jgi:3-hydroxybutyryl-CoA dehydrogenase